MSRTHIRIIILNLLLAILVIAGCGGERGAKTGSASFDLQWNHSGAGKAVAATTSDVCTNYGLQNIRVTFLDNSEIAKASNNFACSDHQGTVNGIPVSDNYTVRIEGFTSTGSSAAWRGEKSGVAVVENAVTPTGTITMGYVAQQPTKGVIKLKSVGSVASAAIKGVEVALALPTGLTLKADTDGVPNSGVVVASGVTPSNATVTAKYSSISGTLNLGIATSTGFKVGEFATINADVVSGTIPTLSGISSPLFSAFDIYGATLSGLTSSVELLLQ